MLDIIDQIPLWAQCLFTILLVVLALEGGYKFGNYHRKFNNGLHEAPVGAMVQTTLGLLAFMLAFTFGVASDRFNDRRTLIIEEANVIFTTYLRAELLPETNKNNVQNLLRKYVDLRVQHLYGNQKEIMQGITVANKIQNDLWQQAAEVGKKYIDADVISLFIDSVNETIELQSKRVAARFYAHIPIIVWLTLYIMVFLGMAAIGYQSGNTNSRNGPITIILILSFLLVIMMIADLDHPGQGLLNTNQQPLIDLAKRIAAPGTSL